MFLYDILLLDNAADMLLHILYCKSLCYITQSQLHPFCFHFLFLVYYYSREKRRGGSFIDVAYIYLTVIWCLGLM